MTNTSRESKPHDVIRKGDAKSFPRARNGQNRHFYSPPNAAVVAR